MAKCVGAFGSSRVSGMVGPVQYHVGRHGQVAGVRSRSVNRRSSSQIIFGDLVRGGNSVWRSLDNDSKSFWNSLLPEPDSGRKLFLATGTRSGCSQYSYFKTIYPAKNFFLYITPRFSNELHMDPRVCRFDLSKDGCVIGYYDNEWSDMNWFHLYYQPCLESSTYCDPSKWAILMQPTTSSWEYTPLTKPGIRHCWVKMLFIDGFCGIPIGHAIFKVDLDKSVLVEVEDGPKYCRLPEYFLG